MRRVGILSALTVGATVIACFLGWLVISHFAPDVDARIAGIAIGDRQTMTRVPRRALDCTASLPSDPRESCTVTLDGKSLQVNVERRDRRLLQFAACEALYNGHSASCWAIWFSLSGGFPLYASIPAVSPGQPHTSRQWLGPGHVDDVQMPHLELRDEALQAIRQQYWVENFYEADWKAVIGSIASVVGSVVAVLACLLMLPRPAPRELSLVSLRHLPGSLVVAAVCGGTAFGLTYVVLIIFAIGASFVD